MSGRYGGDCDRDASGSWNTTVEKIGSLEACVAVSSLEAAVSAVDECGDAAMALSVSVDCSGKMCAATMALGLSADCSGKTCSLSFEQKLFDIVREIVI